MGISMTFSSRFCRNTLGEVKSQNIWTEIVKSDLTCWNPSQAVADNARVDQAADISELIRSVGPYRWTGICDVDMGSGLVSNIVWSGPSGPEFSTFWVYS